MTEQLVGCGWHVVSGIFSSVVHAPHRRFLPRSLGTHQHVLVNKNTNNRSHTVPFFKKKTEGTLLYHIRRRSKFIQVVIT